MTRTVTAPNQKSAMQTFPTLSQMVRDGQADTIQHGRTNARSTRLLVPPERAAQHRAHSLQIARHPLHGFRPPDWRGSRQRVPACQAAQASCRDSGRAAGRNKTEAIARGETYFYPGWRTALERHEVKPSRGRSATYAWRQGHEPACAATTSSPKVSLYEGDSLTLLRSMRGSIQADVCITSPPYFQKFDYQSKGQYGLESSVAEYLRVQVSVFHEVQRLLCEGGTCFIVIGDTSNNYSPIRAKGQRKGGDKQWLMRRSLEASYREKETLNIPFRLAEALRQDGWIHRSTLIWDKIGGSVVANSDATPECHEYVLHMIKWSSKTATPLWKYQTLESRQFSVITPSHIPSMAVSFRSAWSRNCCRSVRRGR